MKEKSIMSKYGEFMKDIFVRRLPCGVNNLPPRTLRRAFEGMPVDDSPERMERLRKTLEKSQIGRETLKFLEEKGSAIGFERMDYYGYFSPDENRVALNPAFSDEDLAITFVHEVRHARQDSIMSNTASTMTPETLLKNGFMIEADACAAECVLAHQMLDLGDPSILIAHQKTGYAPMSTAFEKEFAQSHDWDKARNAAFMEWYNLGVKPGYADSYISFMKEIGKRGDATDFSDSFAAKEMAQKLCINSDGKGYIGDPERLESPEKLNVNAHQARSMASAAGRFMKRFKRSAEKLGLDKVFVEHDNGTYTTVRDTMNDMNARAALRAASKGKGKGGR